MKSWPWVYEAYAPLQLETWMKVKIEVKGRTAKLYLNDPKIQASSWTLCWATTCEAARAMGSSI